MQDNNLVKYSIFGMIGVGGFSTLMYFVSMGEAFQYLSFLGALGGGFAFVQFLIYVNVVLRAALLAFGIYTYLNYQKGNLGMKFMGMAGLLFLADVIFSVLTLISMVHNIDIYIVANAASLAFFVHALKKSGVGA